MTAYNILETICNNWLTKTIDLAIPHCIESSIINEML